ncbi:MAG: hypothetical protein J7M08_08550 [Planctomycetes bacterium]|nr:hypothetical protein [Planctomycetota bacterium]
MGVKRIAASMLFLRPAITRSLRRHVTDHPSLDALLSRFQDGDGNGAGRPSVSALPAAARMKIYERLRRVAARHRIQVQICACENPDLPSQYCGIAGEPHPAPPRVRQQRLFHW